MFREEQQLICNYEHLCITSSTTKELEIASIRLSGLKRDLENTRRWDKSTPLISRIEILDSKITNELKDRKK